MSGMPNKEDIGELKKEFRDLASLQKQIIRSEKEIDESTSYLRTLKSSEAGVIRRIEQLMERMDVKSTGNFGYEARLFMLLVELSQED